MNIKTVIIACLVSALAGFAVGYYTGGEYIRRIYLRINRRMTHPYMDFKQVENLTPYTEPDLEQVRKEAYEDGYNAGFGRKIDASYQEGLSDAWEAARKIICEMDYEDHMKIFGGDNLDYIFALSPTTVIEKLKAYEQEQEYRVGDEFENGAGRKFVVLKMDGKEIDRYIDGDGKTYVMKEKYSVMRKTGRSFPEIAAVLEKMRGEQE